MRGAWALGLLLLLGACSSSGEPAYSFLNTQVATAYIPLSGSRGVFFTGYGAGTVIGRGIAVTNAHNANLLDPDTVIATSMQYDLMFFHTDTGAAPPAAKPWVAEEVIAYGEGTSGELRTARGRVVSLDAPVVARCATCGIQHAFTFEANAGPGFSGGPVVDATTGALVGIVFGFDDEKNGGRLMYAYDMDRVNRELATAQGRVPVH